MSEHVFPRCRPLLVLLAACVSASVAPTTARAQEQLAGTPLGAQRRGVVRAIDVMRLGEARAVALAPVPAPRPMPIPDALAIPVDAAGPAARAVAAAGEAARAAGPLAPPIAALSPPASSSFPGLGDDDSTIPPDTDGAVGPSHLVVALNNGVRIQDRSGGTIGTVTLSAFFAPVYGGTNAFDPHVVYDPFHDRWIVTALADARLATSQLLVAVSQTSDPTGAWNVASYDVDAGNALWGDYPQLGFNKDWIVVQYNVFTNAADDFVRSDVLVIDKLDAYVGGTNPPTRFMVAGQGGTQVPALTYDDTLATEYLVTNFNGDSGGSGFLRLYTITGPVGAETFGLGPFVSVPDPWDFGPPAFADFAPQLGSAQRIQTNDARMMGLVYRNGTLWTTQDVFLPAGGAPTRSAIQWWQIAPAGIVVQRGRIDDPSATTFFAFPSIAVNKDDGVLIGYSRFSAAEYASASYAFRAAADPPGTLQSETLLKAGEAPYYKTFSGPDNRWGDYSATVVDPVNDTDLWTIQEYAASPADHWGTWWGRVVPPPTPTPTPSATPTAPTPTPTAGAAGTTLYGIEGSTIYEIDPDAHTVTPLSPVLPFQSSTIASIDPSAIYVATFDNTTLESLLYRYRRDVGVTLVGSLERQTFVGLGEGRDGLIYGVDSSALFTIDPLDPAPALIGVQPAVAGYAGDVAADPAGNLFGARNDQTLVAVSKVDGSQTAIGSTPTNFWGLAFSRDGRLWGTQASSGDLYQIDPTTGAASFVMGTVPAMADLASELACGNGIIEAGEDCDDANVVSGDGCSENCEQEPCFSCTGAPSTCTQLPDDIACDDGTLCTIDNRCTAGVCVGDAVPVPGCRAPVLAHKAVLLIKDKTPNRKDKVVWKWIKGEATAIGDFGMPATSTDYELCIYDATPSLLARYRVPAGGVCAGRPCWQATTKKDKYGDKDLTPDGVQKLLLKPGAVDGKAKVFFKGKGAHLQMPTLPIANLPVTVQLKDSDGECWVAVYGTPTKNQSDQFKAKALVGGSDEPSVGD